MRQIRFLLTLVSCSVAFLLLLAIGPWRGSTEETVQVRGNMGAFFDWRTPSSLFPPSAIISITDDNSTNFLARPAAFGPLLPPSSLTGQIWIGSGFGDDHLGRGGSGAGAGAEGELGCSDVPGWEAGTWYGSGSGKKSNVGESNTVSDSKTTGGNGKSKTKRSSTLEGEDEEDAKVERPAENDGTDDYLHHPLTVSSAKGDISGNTKKVAHADIQSLQESAEISGKIVLLSRGGCGFLEKVKWVQRRGGVALIVGDNVRGGPLVTMYARGETSNVTIPSVFISHMTAQLLSSLMPSGALGGSEDESNRLGLAASSKSSHNIKASKKVADKPTFTTTDTHTRHMPTIKATKREKSAKKAIKGAGAKESPPTRAGLLRSWLGNSIDNSEDSRRPPSSGNIGLVLHEEVEDQLTGEMIIKPATTSTSTDPTVTPKNTSGDGFVIGVQDWRDPDLVAEQKELHLQEQAEGSSSEASGAVEDLKSTNVPSPSLEGNSIIPGSGEYAKSHHEAIDIPHATDSKSKDTITTSQQTKTGGHPDPSRSWLSRLFHHSNPSKSAKTYPNPHEAAPQAAADHDQANPAKSGSSSLHLLHNPSTLSSDGPQTHEGLWVTLSPTSMSSSPFFDTLLVLVVSPLVTLTVVYALLLLRSRIRRRRWRAPKSVVERLPVRTYQTMPSGTTSSTTSSVTSLASVTTPLLPTTSRTIRPRSRTASEIAPQSSSLLSDHMASPSLEQVEEKRAAGLAEWRRRYGGKQRECVVCLDEYVDGVSRVMSLPCGHEFHAECITPWLTTRRRTCPICKGDVVRSLARNAGYLSSPGSGGSSHDPLLGQYFHDDEEHRRGHSTPESEELQEQVTTTANNNPTALLPVSREDEAFEDLERGDR